MRILINAVVVSDTAELLLKLGANPNVAKTRQEDLAPGDEGSIGLAGSKK